MEILAPFPIGAYRLVRTIHRPWSDTRIVGPIRPSSPLRAIVRNLPMSGDTPDREITTVAEFDSALQTLLVSALENGLDPEGAWAYRNGEAYSDLEVLVTELAKQR